MTPNSYYVLIYGWNFCGKFFRVIKFLCLLICTWLL